MVPVAHSYLSPNQPEYAEIEARIPHYEYDPRKASQMIEGLGYARATDGSMRDAAGERLEVEIRNIGLEISRKSMFAVADYWGRIGLGVSTVVIPQQRVSDYEYRATFPGFQLFNQPNDVRGLPNLHSSRTRLPETNYLTLGAGNHSRYMNPEFDALLDRYSATIPRAERVQVLGEIAYHIADELNLMGLFYNGGPELVSKRITGVTKMRASGSAIDWNAHDWDVR
jgi:ABC-type transport system substrate-binding protein